MSIPFILASSSLNRKALLDRLGIDYTVEKPNFEEIVDPSLSTEDLVEGFAVGKAKSVYEKNEELRMKNEELGDFLILGCDSMIRLEGRSVGKAESREEAMEQMMFFRGKRQEVITGMAIIGQIDGQYVELVQHENTGVTFRSDYDEALLEKYLDFDDWQGKCGSYSILGTGIFLLESFDGDFQNIVGLPILRLGNMIEQITGKPALEVLKKG